MEYVVANRLESEDSPYLQQHKDNPVDWYPWSDEAFQKAVDEKKPIFVSIGYSSCHWCHVMERESFENTEIAQQLNSSFISIKIDREERPDLDKHYQDLYYLVYKKGGGWPLSIFLTHEKKPFHIDTYIPAGGDGKGGMAELLPLISKSYIEDFDGLNSSAEKLDRISQVLAPKNYREIDDRFIERYLHEVRDIFDGEFGGFSTAPKFPNSGTLNTLTVLDNWDMVNTTLQEMVQGGFYDLVDGGFCRYSVDREWLVPHFEKMSYDNGLLLETYSNSYLKFQIDIYKRVALETAEFLIEKMSKNSLFYSASDADSGGVEGGYFTFTPDEADGKIDLGTLSKLSITSNGNFDGRSIIRTGEPQEFQNELKILKEIRQTRDYPAIDKKIIVSWNSMVIKGLLRASLIDSRYLEVARESMHSLLEQLFINKTLYHSKIIDGTPKIEAFLEDYAYLIDALLELYNRTLDKSYLVDVKRFLKIAVDKFYRDDRWFISADGDFETEAEADDGSYPSSVAKIINSLLSSATLLDSLEFFEIAEKSLQQIYGTYLQHPPAFATVTEALYRYKKGVVVVKSTRSNLEKLNNQTALTLHKVSEDSSYEICGVGQCYKSLDTAFEVEQFLKSRIS